MRILHVNKFLYRRGGAEGYMEDVAALQVVAGHDVAFFAMAHPQNRRSEYERHFPSYLELAPPPPSMLGKARATARILYSRSSRQGMEAILDEFQPHIVHLHNIYEHLSPSVLRPLAKRGVPAVMTLHDYKLACPTYQLLDRGRLCEACIGGSFHQAVLRRCKDGSLGASAVCAAEAFVHRVTQAYAPVRRFICPSQFLAEKMRAARVFPDRLRCVRHFIDSSSVAAKDSPGGDIVFAGRLSSEKGVDVLIEAVGRLSETTRVDIAGDGPQRAELEDLAARRAPGQVRFHGRLARDELNNLIRSSSVLAMPSRWYENQPMIILEAFACGVPVVASKLGGAPELGTPGLDGMLVEPNDPDALAEALQDLIARPDVGYAFGVAGRNKIEREYSPSRHLDELNAVYAEAVADTLVD